MVGQPESLGILAGDMEGVAMVDDGGCKFAIRMQKVDRPTRRRVHL